MLLIALGFYDNMERIRSEVDFLWKTKIVLLYYFIIFCIELESAIISHSSQPPDSIDKNNYFSSEHGKVNMFVLLCDLVQIWLNPSGHQTHLLIKRLVKKWNW